MAKVLLLDIETSPKTAFIWSMWKENIGISQLVSDGYVLCWCAKWLDSNKVLSDALTPKEVATENDSRICESVHELLCEADVVIGHNGDRFDIPTLNARFVTHGFQPPDKYKTVDTLKIARHKFKFTSNRLDALGMFLGEGRKISTGGFDLWRDVMLGDELAMRKMVKYCKQDVKLLEKVYLRLRAWDNKHPNMAMFEDGGRPRCNCCSSEKVHSKGLISTNSKLYRRWKCVECGHEMRSPYCEKDKQRDENRFTSI